MPVIARWYDESEHIIVQEYIGKWTVNEFFPSYNDVKRMFASTNQTIYVLLDQSQASHMMLPNIMIHVQNVVNLAKTGFQNWGLAIFVTQSHMNSMLYNVGMKISAVYREKVRICRTTQEALEIICLHRQPKSATVS